MNNDSHRELLQACSLGGNLLHDLDKGAILAILRGANLEVIKFAGSERFAMITVSHRPSGGVILRWKV
jgi:hypothetical protein